MHPRVGIRWQQLGLDKIQDRLLRCERSKVLDKAFKALNATLSVFSHNSIKHLTTSLSQHTNARRALRRSSCTHGKI